jgi:outer membrane protein
MRRYILPVLFSLLSTVAVAQEPERYPGLGDGDTTPGTPQLPQDLELSVAAGVAVQPDYMGASDYEVIFDPALKLEYKQRAFLVVNRQAMMTPYEGLGMKLLANQDFSLGVNVTHDMGREDDSDRIRGIGDVDWTVLGGVFGAYHPGPFFIRGQVGYDLLDEFNSYKGEFGAGIAAPINPSWRGMIELATAFSGENHQEKFFGVSTAQGIATGGRLTTFDADGGFYRVGLSGTLQYQFTQGAFAQGLARIDKLVGDAAESSISEDDVQLYVGTNVGYKF